MLICKICNPDLEGNGYCAKHSTSGTEYNCREPMPKTPPPNKIIGKVEEAIDEYTLGIGEPFGFKPGIRVEPYFDILLKKILKALATQRKEINKKRENKSY